MTAVLAVWNSSGPAGRCDSTCYDARFPECDCICKGRNHGKGRAAAEENSRELAATWRDYAARLGGLPFGRVEAAPDTLF